MNRPYFLHISYFPLALSVGFLSGIILVIVLKLDLFAAAIFFYFGLVLALISFWRFSKIAIYFTFIAGAVLGVHRASLDFADRQALAPYIGKNLTITGAVSEDPDISSHAISLKVHQISLNGQTLRGLIFAKISLDESKRLPEFIPRRSDIITLSGRFRAGFGAFAGSITRAKLIKLVRPKLSDPLLDIRDHFASKVKSAIRSPGSDLALGYLLGSRSAISEELSKLLQISGLTHIVVASGANLAILANFSKKLFGRTTRFANFFISSLLISGFVFMVGLSPSMLRAGLVAILSLAAWYFGYHWVTGRLILYVACITLIFSPLYLLDLGWLLSFGAFIGIIVCSPLFTKFFYGDKPPNFIRSALIETLSATILCLPILVYFFGSFSWLSPLANILILPTISFVMATSFLAGVFNFIPLFAQFFGLIAGFITDYNLKIIKFFGSQTLFLFQIKPQNPLAFLLYLPIVTLIFYLYFQTRDIIV